MPQMCSSVPPDKIVTDVVLYKDSAVVHSLKLDKTSSQAGIVPHFSAGLSEGVTSVLQNELDSCLQLLELEPDSKCEFSIINKISEAQLKL